jgi:flagellar motor switch protein FliN/FliY
MAENTEDMATQWEEALKEQGEPEEKENVPDEVSDKGSSHNVSTQPGAKAAETGRSPDLDFILDIPLEISVELGRTKMLIGDLLRLGHGSVIELDKVAGEPLEVLVNRRLIARGETVVVNDKFGVRLTDVVSPVDRVKKLG